MFFASTSAPLASADMTLSSRPLFAESSNNEFGVFLNVKIRGNIVGVPRASASKTQRECNYRRS